MDKQQGAAVVEFCVLCTAMVILMFAIPMVGNMIDARQASIQAGRYALWQSTVDLPGGENVTLLQDRFFSGTDALISSHTTDADENRLWGSEREAAKGMAGQTAIAIEDASIWMNTRAHADDSGLNVSAGVGAAIEAVGDAIGSVTDRTWGMGDTALTRTEIGVEVKSNGWFSATAEEGACGGFGCLTQRGALLVDGWSAGGETQAKERTQAIVPATALEPIGDVVSVLGNIPIFEELKDMDGMFGHVDMRPLPEHANRGLNDYVDE